MNNPTPAPPVFKNFLTFAALTLIMAVALTRYRVLFLQPGASTFVLQSALALFAYAVAVICIARSRRENWNIILRTVVVFGLISGGLNLVDIGIENGLPFPLHGAAQQISFMLAMFVIWGIAGFSAANSLHSISSGLLAAVCSAGFCMVIAVTGGFIIQFFLAPASPFYVSTWPEFVRSGWTDARAFALANTLDSAFTHLVIAPIVALLFGGVAALIASFRFPKPNIITP